MVADKGLIHNADFAQVAADGRSGLPTGEHKACQDTRVIAHRLRNLHHHIVGKIKTDLW